MDEFAAGHGLGGVVIESNLSLVNGHLVRQVDAVFGKCMLIVTKEGLEQVRERECVTIRLLIAESLEISSERAERIEQTRYPLAFNRDGRVAAIRQINHICVWAVQQDFWNFCGHMVRRRWHAATRMVRA